MGEDSPVSRRSSTLFGIHSESKALKELKRVRAQNRRFSIIAAAAIFLLVVALISLVVFDLYTNAAIVTGQNRTGHASVHRIEHLGHLIAAQQWNAVQDVKLGPQEDISLAEGERRWGKEEEENDVGEDFGQQDKEKSGVKMDQQGVHANHRYTEEEPFFLEERSSWKPRPFTLNVDSQIPSENNIDEALGRHQQTTLPPGFSNPVRFRGVYVHPKLTTAGAGAAFDVVRDENYYQKINDIFSRQKKGRKPALPVDDNSDNNADNTVAASNTEEPENSGLYTQAIFPASDLTTPKNDIDNAKSWHRKNAKPRRKPFTVMLDIYPMGKDEENEKHLIDANYQKKKPRDTIFIPIKPGEQFIEPDYSGQRYLPQVMLPPKQRRKNSRMLMKLNLFPRNSGNRKKGQRRTWNMFSRQSEDEEEEEEEEVDDSNHPDLSSCNGIVGHNPYGKPITAKWKDSNGEWVHAKYVSMQQWDDRMDSGIDPR